jgi:hypothetical protein
LNLEVFCCLGLLKFPEQLESSLKLLRDEDRAEALRLLEGMRDLPQSALRERWSTLRSEEYAAVTRRVRDLSGIHLEDLPPALRDWWSLWAEHRHE